MCYKKLLGIVLVLMLIVGVMGGTEVIGCTEEEDDDMLGIVDIAANDGRFATLITALEAAGLVDALKEEGPFTLFAPTDAAFEALPEGTLEGLLADIPALTDVLTYHVVPGKVMAADVVELISAETLQGQSVTITVGDDGNVMINDANVVETDIKAANGVIHVIDKVLTPPDLVGLAGYDSRLTTLTTALEAAGLDDALKEEGPFTLFAPTDAAFEALPEGTLEGLLADIPALTDVLTYHVVPGGVMAADVVELTSAETLQGQSVSITVMDGNVMINDANVIETDMIASNGVIHVIDKVLIP